MHAQLLPVHLLGACTTWAVPSAATCCTGTRACFEVALDYMTGFGTPFSLITGNHGGWEALQPLKGF